MRKTRKIPAIFLSLVIIFACFSLSAFAGEEAYVCIGDGKYYSEANGNGWTLSCSDSSFKLNLSDGFTASILQKNGYIGAYNCSLEIIVGSEATFKAGHAEDSAPYDLYVIYAENSSVTVSGGDLYVETKEARSAVPFCLVNSTLTINGASFNANCFGKISVLDSSSKLNVLAGTKVVVNEEEKVITDEGEVVEKTCEHVDEDEDGVCDLCDYVLFETEVTEDPEEETTEKTCPLCGFYNEHKDDFIWNFFVRFLHSVVHAFFSH